ncbi:Kae1-associated serine/threonine protein kinase [Parabacteroides sp. 52]|uniref:serine/threonine protein kinase n=1 Tax=unclassified Parabacteroides TaxID=2649774 RepID=UPI0013D3C1CB|nr:MULTISPECIES: serine/threonine-protein kinase [unclassified Parabacteroides]MDH6533458.1 Kae1-associated kinase Bud32 [Parabacteroides sp. PM5-20]NDV54214.1 Kae1-associated serine/threonine protein kinase [Parabacteroides sp. 52]
MNLPNGHLLQNGKYRLTHIVGQGGFGITYKGVWYTEVKGSLGTVKTEVPIAIKEYFFKDYCYREQSSYAVKVHSETGKNLFHKFKEKLIKEARILSDVHHPHIVNVLEVFEENNTAYIAMEYIAGLSLKEMMEREGILPEKKVLKYVHQVGEALQFVHENNILHLDIKPSNILIDRNDNARLIDFGVSKRYDEELQETSTTILTLSKGFASIEQYDNEGTQNFSPYPDIYSLGATMYNLLTSKIPTESILRATRSLSKPIELNPAISEKTERAIVKAMEIIPADRFSDIREMLEALDKPPQEELKEPVHAPNPQLLPNTGGEDTTLLYNPVNRTALSNDTDEQTILNHQEENRPKERKRKRLYITLLFMTIALVASAITYIFYTSKPVVVDPIVRTTPPNNTTDPVTSSSLQEENKEDIEEEKEEHLTIDEPKKEVENHKNQSVINESTTSLMKPDTQKEPVSTTVQETPTPVIEINQPTEEEIDATYKIWITSAKEKKEKEDYKGAITDLNRAKELKLTEEVFDLINEVKEEAKEKEIADRKALYEEKEGISFGELTIVRKKVNRLYGAIDNEGIERIPCEYPYNEKSGDNRAFIRENGDVDIYNNRGRKVKE